VRQSAFSTPPELPQSFPGRFPGKDGLLEILDFIGEPVGIRTHDPMIKSLSASITQAFAKTRFSPCPHKKALKDKDISLTNQVSTCHLEDTARRQFCGHGADTGEHGNGEIGQRPVAPDELADSIVRRLEPTEGRNRIKYDTKVKGFGVRVTPAGAKSFIFNYRTKAGRERRYTIAAAGEGGLKVGAAREEAEDIKAKLRTQPGYDPLAEIEAERDAPTVVRLCERFTEEHLPKKRLATQQDYTRAIDLYILPELKHRKVADLDYSDIDGLHRKVTKKGGPYRANRVVAILSKMFSLAIKWKWCDANPARGVERTPEIKRRRYLDGDELVRLTGALDKHKDQQAANIIRMLLLTGARRGEVMGARWDHFDLKAGVWTKPGSTTRQKTEHRVPLSAPLRKLLSDIHAAAEREAKKKHRPVSEFVFPGRSAGHRVEIKKDRADLRLAAGIIRAEAIDGTNGKPRMIVKHSARIHDLRHTYASVLASAGLSLPVIGALLGHSQPATTARYSHLFDDPLRAATEKAASVIAPADDAAGDVIRFPKGSAS
jgi:integrase